MTPAGYLLKRVSPPAGWLGPAHVVDVCSVSHCVNDDVVDVQGAWRHNGCGLANAPEALLELAADGRVDLAGSVLFYYEAYELEAESGGGVVGPAAWRPRTPARSAGEPTDVSPPDRSALTPIGYDVVVFGDYLEHSPLSCNGIAKEVAVNARCLFDSLEDAVEAVDLGRFLQAEPGTYTIFSIAVVAQPWTAPPA